MRILANWLSGKIQDPDNKYAGHITKIISPYYFVNSEVFNNKSSHEDYLICNKVSSDKVQLTYTNISELNKIKNQLIQAIKNNDCGDSELNNNFNFDNFLKNGKSDNLQLLLEKLKTIERNYDKHIHIDHLKEYAYELKKDFSYQSEKQDSSVALKHGSYPLISLLEKVKELQKPDVYKYISHFTFENRDSITSIYPQLTYKKIQQQFNLDESMAKHIIIATTCDIVLVDNEEDLLHFSHILNALQSPTNVLLADQFNNWFKKFTDHLPQNITDFTDLLLNIIKDKNWTETREEYFSLKSNTPILSFFNSAYLNRYNNKLKQLCLANSYGNLTKIELDKIANYLSSILPQETSNKYAWQLQKIGVKLNTENNQLIFQFT